MESGGHGPGRRR